MTRGRASLFECVVQFERDATQEQASAAYQAVTEALRASGIRFAAFLKEVPEAPKPKVIGAVNTLWTGGDLGG